MITLVQIIVYFFWLNFSGMPATNYASISTDEPAVVFQEQIEKPGFICTITN